MAMEGHIHSSDSDKSGSTRLSPFISPVSKSISSLLTTSQSSAFPSSDLQVLASGLLFFGCTQTFNHYKVVEIHSQGAASSTPSYDVKFQQTTTLSEIYPRRSCNSKRHLIMEH
jgi:hypothetical protein